MRMSSCMFVAVLPVLLLTLVNSQGLVPTPRKLLTSCNHTFDVVFVVDATVSYSDLEIANIKSSLVDFIDSLTSEQRRIGIVFKGTIPNMAPSDLKNVVINALHSIVTQGPISSESGIGDAVDLYTNFNIPLIMIIITNAPTLTTEKSISSEAARNAGIDVFAIGISQDVPLNTLQIMATSGGHIYRTQALLLDVSIVDIKYSVCTFPGLAPPITQSPPNFRIDCRTVFDILLVIDGSQSIGQVNFDKLKEDIHSFIASLPINSNEIHAGVILYSGKVEDQSILTQNRSSILNGIDQFIFPEKGTFTNLGLDAARQMFVNFGRTYVPKIVVLISDGVSDNRTATMISANRLKVEGVRIYTVGIGAFSFDTTELTFIASSPALFLEANGFDDLYNVLLSSSFTGCDSTTQMPPTTPPILTTQPSYFSCSRVFNLMLVLDSSMAAGDNGFKSIKAAVQGFVSRFPISVTGINIGVVAFGTIAQGFPPQANVKTINEFTGLLGYLGGQVNTQKGLQTAVAYLTASSRSDLPKHIAVITAGESSNIALTSTVAKITRNISINTFAVGVGRSTFITDLENIAGDLSRVYYASNYASLPLRLEDIQQALCLSDTVTQPPSTTPPYILPTTPPVVHPTPSPSTGTTPQGICDMVTAEVKIGVGPLPFNCDKYVQCYFRNASSVVAVYRQCPYGHYWNQVNKTCDYSSNVLCPYAICTSSCKTKYKMDGSCRSYWQCNNGKQEPKCCPMGYAFVAGHGCKPDSSCKDSCPSRCKHAPCDKKPNWSNEMSYDIYMGLFGYLPMSCSPGRFDVAECACSFSSNINNKSCYQAVTLNFTDPKQLQTKDDVGIIVQNVSVVGGFAVFNSNSHIHFNLQMRNKTMNSEDCKPKKEVSHQIVVSFKYREVSPIEGERVLIGTGDCGKGGRMYITYDTSAVHFIVESRNGAATNITILTTDFPENEWKEINFIYDGSRVEGRVSSGGIQHVSKLSAPSTKLLECGLGVGIGGLMSGFKGQLDDLSVYICSNSY